MWIVVCGKKKLLFQSSIVGVFDKGHIGFRFVYFNKLFRTDYQVHFYSYNKSVNSISISKLIGV